MFQQTEKLAGRINTVVDFGLAYGAAFGACVILVVGGFIADVIFGVDGSMDFVGSVLTFMLKFGFLILGFVVLGMTTMGVIFGFTGWLAAKWEPFWLLHIAAFIWVGHIILTHEHAGGWFTYGDGPHWWPKAIIFAAFAYWLWFPPTMKKFQ